MGSEYWQDMVNWMKKTMLEEYGCISPEDMDVFTVIDDPAQAVDIITAFQKSNGRGGLMQPYGIRKPVCFPD